MNLAVLKRLDEILAGVRAAVAASVLEDAGKVTVTDNGPEVAAASSLRAGAIIVYPFPAETRPSPRMSRLAWTIAVVADGDTPRESAERTQDLLTILRATDFFRAEDNAVPTDFEMTDRSTLPGYTITHIEEHR